MESLAFQHTEARWLIEKADPRDSTFAILVTIVWGVLLVPGLIAAALSVMFFDAPGSVNNPGAWLNALLVASFPVLCVVSIAGTWIIWHRQKGRPVRRSNAPIIVACLPLLPVAFVIVLVIIAAIGLIVTGRH